MLAACVPLATNTDEIKAVITSCCRPAIRNMKPFQNVTTGIQRHLNLMPGLFKYPEVQAAAYTIQQIKPQRFHKSYPKQSIKYWE